MQSTANLPVIGMDIAKNVFQIHCVDPETGEVERHKIKREKVPVFFANHKQSLVAMEACGGAHHWARTLQAMGHEVKLLPANHVRPFVLRDKTDARDAQAIWVAAQQPHIKAVPVKSEQQQACLALHRIRAQLMNIRIMQTNALRGLLYEFGIALSRTDWWRGSFERSRSSVFTGNDLRQCSMPLECWETGLGSTTIGDHTRR